MTAGRMAAFAALLLMSASGTPALAQNIAQQRNVGADEPTVDGRVVIDAGHVDLGPRLIDGAFEIQIRDDAAEPPAWRDPRDVVLTVPAAAALDVPGDPRFRFLGAAGEKSYVLPQVQDERFVWPGWNTQDPAITREVKREVEWSLDAVDGPGSFSLFSSDGFGEPQVLFDSGRKLPQRFAIDLDTHGHGNWAFSAPGTYALQVSMTATGGDGAELKDRAALQFAVGDVDPRTAFAAAPAPTGESESGAGSWPVAAGVVLFVAVLVALGLRRKRLRPATEVGAP